jgi:hypothetical protein
MESIFLSWDSSSDGSGPVEARSRGIGSLSGSRGHGSAGASALILIGRGERIGDASSRELRLQLAKASRRAGRRAGGLLPVRIFWTARSGHSSDQPRGAGANDSVVSATGGCERPAESGGRLGAANPEQGRQGVAPADECPFGETGLGGKGPNARELVRRFLSAMLVAACQPSVGRKIWRADQGRSQGRRLAGGRSAAGEPADGPGMAPLCRQRGARRHKMQSFAGAASIRGAIRSMEEDDAAFLIQVALRLAVLAREFNTALSRAT